MANWHQGWKSKPTSNGNTTNGSNGHSADEKLRTIKTAHDSFWNRMKFRRDYRASLSPHIARFTGYRDPNATLPYEPLPFPPFIWLKKIPLEVETWIFAWFGSFVGILLIEAIMSASTAFQEVYQSPIIITSFGASAVLLFDLIDSPIAQPRNFVGGHFISAFMGTWITRLWVLNPRYEGYLDNHHFHANTYVNGGLSTAFSLLAMILTGTTHPPAGATGLNAAVQAEVVPLSWRYLPVVLASSLIMLGWAMITNNLGRRRYPLHWWAPGVTFVREEMMEKGEEQYEAMEEARMREEDREEGEFQRENISTDRAVERAEEPEGVDASLDAEPPDLKDIGDLAAGR